MVECRKLAKGEKAVKRLFLLSVFAVAGFCAAAAPAGAQTFVDVGDSHRAKMEINYLATGQIVNGSLDGHFYPDKQVTRAEAAAMIGRTLQFNGKQVSTDFSDVGIQNFASGYIQEAARHSIITGYKDGSFKPDQPVARGEMAIMISRAFGYGASTINSAAKALMDKGIAQGVADGTFGTTNSIKRSDFSVFLARSINSELRLNGSMPEFTQTDTVNADSLNMRSGPSTLYDVKSAIPFKGEVKIGYKVGKWAFIQYDGKTGFVHTDFLASSVGGSSSQIAGKTIVIDPGHGGTDPGASGYGLLEKTVTQDTALRVQNYFKQTPFNILLTQEKDPVGYKTELSDRVAFARNHNADIFVSIHCNSFNGTADGTETYYYAAYQNPHVDESKALATYVQKRMLDALDLKDRGIDNGDFHVIRENTMPAILTELAFIDNKSDNAKLASSYWRQEAAKAIYLGILDYYYNYKKIDDVLPLYNLLQAQPSTKWY
ncbi:N-acetylmuramoyl-L-alanine amidase [Falsibacillus pallidus]|uniref:N-acetylmuramoyl-L-alanine amidase n=1 Tax=Falsibacillus pallidus TaxID=493781 RepID=A0A370G857_9BACI|nr:N-acetylmuramoyl-L-alanine amidase [Falsibacillus pallidus]